MKFLKVTLLATALVAAPALAQDAAVPPDAAATTAAPAQDAAVPAATTAANPQVVAGATVYGPQGEVVGTIEGIVDGIATLDTGMHKAPLPLNAFGQGETGPTITVTREQLNQLIEQQLAQLAQQRDAALVQGAAVLSADNQPLGTVEQVAGDNVIVARPDGETRFGLQRDLFAVDEAGLKTRLTLQEIEASIGQGGTAQ